LANKKTHMKLIKVGQMIGRNLLVKKKRKTFVTIMQNITFLPLSRNPKNRNDFTHL